MSGEIKWPKKKEKGPEIEKRQTKTSIVDFN